MDESSEIKFLKARVALLETEKKHLIQKVADLGKKKSEAPRHILSSSSNVSIIPEENQPDYPIEQKIQLLKNIFRGRVSENFFIRRKMFNFRGSKRLKE